MPAAAALRHQPGNLLDRRRQPAPFRSAPHPAGCEAAAGAGGPAEPQRAPAGWGDTEKDGVDRRAGRPGLGRATHTRGGGRRQREGRGGKVESASPGK